MAEINKEKVKIQNDYIMVPFDRANQGVFRPFSARTKYNLMHAIFEQEFEISTLKQSGIIFESFMLHTRERSAILQSWNKYKW